MLLCCCHSLSLHVVPVYMLLLQSVQEPVLRFWVFQCLPLSPLAPGCLAVSDGATLPTKRRLLECHTQHRDHAHNSLSPPLNTRSVPICVHSRSRTPDHYDERPPRAILYPVWFKVRFQNSKALPVSSQCSTLNSPTTARDG